MKLSDLCSYLDSAVPLAFQEEYDNSGLQVGQPANEINRALLTLDVTEEVLDEARMKECDVIISHHPLIFRGLKKISGKTAPERIIINAIKNDIGIYTSHTNLDMLDCGVSRKMAQKLGLQGVKVLSPLKNRLLKLVTFIPDDHLDRVREAVFSAGGGSIGYYDNCGFTVNGTGSFKPAMSANPFRGEPGKIHFEREVRFETIILSYMKEPVLKALLDTHPYEEVAYDLYPLENTNIQTGLGCIGLLPEPLDKKGFLDFVSSVFDAQGIRYSSFAGSAIRKIAVCGGSGIMLLSDAISAGADAFITGDIKYHAFFDAENRIMLVDCGHFETEKFSTEILHDLIIKKFPNFALLFSETKTNPINYL